MATTHDEAKLRIISVTKRLPPQSLLVNMIAAKFKNAQQLFEVGDIQTDRVRFHLHGGMQQSTQDESAVEAISRMDDKIASTVSERAAANKPKTDNQPAENSLKASQQIRNEEVGVRRSLFQVLHPNPAVVREKQLPSFVDKVFFKELVISKTWINETLNHIPDTKILMGKLNPSQCRLKQDELAQLPAIKGSFSVFVTSSGDWRLPDLLLGDVHQIPTSGCASPDEIMEDMTVAQEDRNGVARGNIFFADCVSVQRMRANLAKGSPAKATRPSESECRGAQKRKQDSKASHCRAAYQEDQYQSNKTDEGLTNEEQLTKTSKYPSLKQRFAVCKGLGAVVSEVKKGKEERLHKVAYAENGLQVIQPQQGKDHGELQSREVAERIAGRVRIEYLLCVFVEKRAAHLSGAIGYGATSGACRQTESLI